jgi:D-xylose transport system substrate-binding protein
LLQILSVLFIFFVSCSSGEKNKIGFLFPHLSNERYPKDSALFTEEIKRLGGEVFVKNANLSEKLQEQQVQELIDKGVDILVINAVNKNTAADMVRKAHENHIKVISYERMIANSNPEFFISFDNVKVGEIMASFAIKNKPKGKYFLLEGDKADQNALWLKEGQMKVLDPYIKSGEIEIVYNTFIESWNKDNSHFEFDRYLRLSTDGVPDVVLTGGDAMAAGVIAALKENGVGVDQFPYITGQNAESFGCKNVVKGLQNMTIYKPIKKVATEAADIAWKMIHNEKVDYSKTTFNGAIEVPTLLIEPIGVDKQNMSIVINDGYLKESQIYE